MIKNKTLLFWILSLLSIVFYFFSRLQNLTIIPVFGDEAIYLRWSQIIKSVETLRFIPLTDGKQPLFMWVTVLFFKIVSDPLIAGRLVSVFSGFFTLIFIYLILLIGQNYSSSQTDFKKFLVESFKKYQISSFLGVFIYLTSTYFFFFDRLAVPDNLLSSLLTVSLFLLLLILKFPRFDLAILLGISLGISWLTKSPAVYFITISLFFLISKFKIKYLFYFFTVLIFSFTIYNILRLGPQFHQINLRNQDYIWSLSEIIKHPFDPLLPHVSDIKTLLSTYFNPLFLIIFVSLLIKKIIKKDFSNFYFYLILFFWFLAPMLATAIFAKVFTARYILFSMPALTLFFSILILELPNRKILLIVLLLQIFPLILNLKLSTNPMFIQLPSTETGYLQDWTSGWGIQTASKYLIDRSSQANVIVGTEGYFGTLPDGLQIYTNQKNQLTVFGVGIGFEKIPEKLIDARNHGDEVYLLLNQSRLKLLPQETDKLEIIQKYLKPKQDYLILYRLK